MIRGSLDILMSDVLDYLRLTHSKVLEMSCTGNDTNKYLSQELVKINLVSVSINGPDMDFHEFFKILFVFLARDQVFHMY